MEELCDSTVRSIYIVLKLIQHARSFSVVVHLNRLYEGAKGIAIVAP